ncbi:MAG: alpha/beta fold hydrolase [Elainellaceae cyanobacterium]
MHLIRKRLPFAALAIATCLFSQACTSTQANSSDTAPETLAQASGNETNGSATEIPCPSVVVGIDEVKGETYDCGIVTVPENYDEPDGRQIELTYAVLYSQSLSPAPDPVIYLAGGPGGGSVYAPIGWGERFAGHRRTRDVVLFDQRGTEYSNRLGCAPVSYVVSNIFSNQESEYFGQIDSLLDRFRAKYPEASEDDLFKYAYMALCGQLLEAHGADLSQYNTANNAQDVVTLATALGYDKINLYGTSYGTYLAQQVMRDYPDRLRSVVLDSTLPQQVKIYEAWVQDHEVVLLNLIEDCDADAACRAAYPNLKARTVALLEQLETSPVPLSSPIPSPIEPDTLIDSVTPDQIIMIMDFLNNFPQKLSPYVPRMIDELEQGITTTYEAILSDNLPTQAEPEEPEESEELVNPALTYRIRAEELQLEAQKLLATQLLQAEQERPATQWSNQVQTLALQLPQMEQLRVVANFLGVGYQSGMPRDRATLLAFVDENFEGEEAQSLSAAVNDMADTEVRHVYEVVSDVTEQLVPIDNGATQGMFWSVACQDIRPFSERAETDAALASLELPQMGASRYHDAIEAYTICENWPVESYRDRPFEAVESDIPTLVLQGRYDAPTTTVVGSQVMTGLSNGTYVELPNTGHGVTKDSECAKDIGVAFVSDPDQELNTSCTEDLKPDFLLPLSATEQSTPADAGANNGTSPTPTAEANTASSTPICFQVDRPLTVYAEPSSSAAVAGAYNKNDIAYASTNPPTTQQADGQVFIEVSIYGGFTGWIAQSSPDGAGSALEELSADQCQ